jgi:hypothetical protein
MCTCYTLNGLWELFFHENTVRRKKIILPILLMILILNPERIVYVDVKSRSL